MRTLSSVTLWQRAETKALPEPDTTLSRSFSYTKKYEKKEEEEEDEKNQRILLELFAERTIRVMKADEAKSHKSVQNTKLGVRASNRSRNATTHTSVRAAVAWLQVPGRESVSTSSLQRADMTRAYRPGPVCFARTNIVKISTTSDTFLNSSWGARRPGLGEKPPVRNALPHPC
ncbi:hypothetical protein ElyMa_004991200 [Elysia marginata]|uniref:Uncharacterized protein n=1 Tax=Elysia marginata TaxID=1093978 RepID=A0AAV4J8W6_9GAST|nr:hypothetical protein ElyMa_004991200 [Elysia marginata]